MILDLSHTALLVSFALERLPTVHWYGKTSLAILVRSDRFFQFFTIKDGPQGASKIKLGISQLPQHEIADARFTAVRMNNQAQAHHS